MTTNINRDAFEKIMASSLDRTIDFIKFAEAKNAALLTFASGCTLALASALISGASAQQSGSAAAIPALMPALTISFVLFVIVVVLMLWSFIAARKPRIYPGDSNQLKNFLFFGNIAKIDTLAFRASARARYFARGEPSLTDAYLDDLTDQIAENSVIADRKFKLFNAGVWLTFVAVIVAITPLVPLVISVATKAIGGP